MLKLKPCPFCGGEAGLLLNAKRKIYGKDEYRTGVVACCNVCEARMFYGSEKLAIEAWNRRAQPERPEQPESAKEYCAECNHIEMCQWYPYEGCEFRSPPSAQPERKKGEWITVNGRLGNEVECNKCHSVFWYWMGNYGFCPSCGARMAGKSVEE